MEGNWFGGAVGIGFLVVIGLIIYSYPVKKTEEILKQVARQCAHTSANIDYKDDWWGNPVAIIVNEGSDEMFRTCIAISSGRDEKFQTDDDIQVSNTNLNTSKVIGDIAGQKSQQFLKGWAQGIKRNWLGEKDE